MCRVLLRFSCNRGALEPSARAGSAAIAGGHCDKFHQVESDVFVAACSGRRALCFIHLKVSPSEMWMSSMIAKLGGISRQLSAIRKIRYVCRGAHIIIM